MKTAIPDKEKSGRWPAVERVLKGVGLCMWLALIVLVLVYRDRVTVGGLADFAPPNPALAVLLLFSLFALKSLTIVFYSGVLFAVSGVLFGVPAAFFVSLGGLTVMLTIPYLIGRRFGGKGLDYLLNRYPKLRPVGEVYVGNDSVFAILIRMMRVVNYDIGSMYMGARKLRYLPYLLGSAVAISPDLVLFTLMGSKLDDPNPTLYAVTIAVQIVFTVISVLLLRHRDKAAQQA